MASVYNTLDARTQEELQQKMFEAAHHGYTGALKELLNAGVPVDKHHESVSVSLCMYDALLSMLHIVLLYSRNCTNTTH